MYPTIMLCACISPENISVYPSKACKGMVSWTNEYVIYQYSESAAVFERKEDVDTTHLLDFLISKLAPEAMDKVVKEGFERVSVSFVNVCGFGFIVSCGQKDSSMCKTPQVVSLRFTAETVQFLGYVVDANADLGMTVEYNATKEKKNSLRLSRDNKSKSTTPVSLTETGRVHAEGNFGNVLEILRRFRRVIHICMNDEHRQKFMGSLSS